MIRQFDPYTLKNCEEFVTAIHEYLLSTYSVSDFQNIPVISSVLYKLVQ